MEDLKTKLLSLTDQELRQYLEECGGYDGTPVTPSTRILLVRKLTRSLLKSAAADDVRKDDASVKPLIESGSEDSQVKDEDIKSATACLDATRQTSKPIYYGIHVPIQLSNNFPSGPEACYVHTEKKEVMKFMKEFPHARFKVFQTRSEAENFAIRGLKASVGVNVSCKDSLNDSDQALVTGEKTSSFKAPKPQDLIQLRKMIEREEVDRFLETVWKNPRYLVGSGDTPTILQEGSRYNALHIASKTGSRSMCEAVLETISNPTFVSLLYDGVNGSQERVSVNGTSSPSSTAATVSEKKDQAVMNCMVYLLDLYLNTPEKGLNETPLHFACKFGKLEAVRVLLSYQQCDRNRLNKFGETAEDIICSRAGKGSNTEKQIQLLLKDHFYVPVMRPEDSSFQASVGDPFSPEKLPTLSPVFKKDPNSPVQEINAFAGPMSLEKAQEFCHKLKSPLKGRNGENENFHLMTPTKSCTSTVAALASGTLFRLSDSDRGLEREARTLAKEFEVGWMEYWPFVSSYANLGSRNGMQLLEKYLHGKLMDTLHSKKNSEDGRCEKLRRLKILDEHGPPEGIPSDVNSPSQQVSPVSGLCHAMESCTLSSDQKNVELPPSRHHLCTILAAETQPSSSPSPLHYVEKSCCIFARRISDLVLRECGGGCKRDLSHLIGLEVHHLCRLVSSFKDDSRFSSLSFNCMHSRIASLAAEGILESTPSSSLSQILNYLEYVPAHSHLCSSSDEDEDKHTEKERNSQTSGIRSREWRRGMRWGRPRVASPTGSTEEHIHCLMALIREVLVIAVARADKGSAVATSTEKEAGRQVESLWTEAKACTCTWPTFSPQYSKNSSRPVAAAVRRLSFDELPCGNGHSEKSPCERWRLSENQISPHDSEQDCEIKDLFLRQRNPSDDSQDSSREDGGSSDTFYTPPSSPRSCESPHHSSNDEEMADTEEIPNVFIGGEHPTKEDLDVLNALENAGSINPNEFPHIYQWRSLVLIHSQEERERWPSPYAPKWRRPQLGTPCRSSSERNLFRQLFPLKSPPCGR